MRSCQRTNQPKVQCQCHISSAIARQYALDERRLRIAARVAKVNNEWNPAIVYDGLRRNERVSPQVTARVQGSVTDATKINRLHNPFLKVAGQHANHVCTTK